MSESKFEAISSLMDNYRTTDNESNTEHAIDELVKDEQLSTTWQNYHLIGDVMREEVSNELQLDLSAQISAAIAKEATILSPNSATLPLEDAIEEKAVETASAEPVSNDPQSNVISAQSRFKAKVSKLLKPLGQVAIAASAAGLMIVGVQQNTANTDLQNPVIPNQVVQTVPFTGYANPVSFNSTTSQASQLSQQQIADKQLAEQRIAQQRRFHALLVDHQQQLKLVKNHKAQNLESQGVVEKK